MRNVIVSTLAATTMGWGAQAVTAQYFGYFVEGGYREVQLDRSKYDAELLYGQLWQTPIGLTGGLARTGLLLDVALRKSRRVSFVWSGALTYAQLSGDFQFGSAAPPFEDLLYSSNGTWYSTQGSRQLDVFHLEGSVGLKLRVTRGLVVRIGGTLGYPVYAIQRTRWTLGLTAENGENYEYRMDETVSGSDVFQSGSRDLFYGSYNPMLEGHAELGYEFKGGLGLFIRGSRSTEQSRRISTYWVSSDWRSYTIGFGLCFRLVRRAPASNWGGAIPLSSTEIRQRRYEERTRSADEISPGRNEVEPHEHDSIATTDELTAIPVADAPPQGQTNPVAPKGSPPPPTPTNPSQEKVMPPVVPTPKSEAPAMTDAQYAGCAVVLELTDGTVTQVRTEEVGLTPQTRSNALHVQWAGRADGKRWLWIRLLPASEAPPQPMRATLAWGDGRRMVIASDLRPVEAEVRPDGNTWYGMHLTDQEWRTVREQMPNELTLVTKSGPLQVVWMEEERRALAEQRSCLDQWFLANASTTMPSGIRGTMQTGSLPPMPPDQPVVVPQQGDLTRGGAQNNGAGAPLGQHDHPGSSSHNAGSTTPSADEVTLAYKVITERPADFGAVHVYTVLHVFSSSNALDTFRVVTRNSPMGGLKHELWISTLTGATYREELYPVPLEGALDAGKNAGEEMEMLRVRMSLAPGAFQPNPISVDDWRLSGSRASRDLLYDLSIAEFETVFFEKPAIGFHFQSDPETRRELVYSTTLRRIVNVAPQ
ncbi:MAG: hypothetical protein IPJ87_01105 [Flavobacteriales bacterium]|nr:hypothetical protein [Flavobacteriales bacterium]MBK9699365.1 hypothetical protein [Flavobacteriales bacterium]